MTTVRDIVPVGLGNAQSTIDRLIRQRAVQQLEAHGVDLFGRLFEIFLDLAQGEPVVSGFIPTGNPDAGAIFKAMLQGRRLQVGPLGNRDTMHGGRTYR